MKANTHASARRIGVLALAGAVVSTLLYYAASDGFRFLVKALLSGGRTLMRTNRLPCW